MLHCVQPLCFCSGALSKARPVHVHKLYKINILNTLMSRHHCANIVLAPVPFSCVSQLSAVLIGMMSTQFLCETHVVGGATVALHFQFTLNSYYFVPVVGWRHSCQSFGLRWGCAALACVLSGRLIQNSVLL